MKDVTLPPNTGQHKDQNLQQAFNHQNGSQAVPDQNASPQSRSQARPQSLGLVFNWEDWLPYLEDAAIPDAQKREMIETLWHNVVGFVDLGFALNPHQQVQKSENQQDQQSCGQNLDLKMLLEDAVLKSATAQEIRPETHNRKPK